MARRKRGEGTVRHRADRDLWEVRVELEGRRCSFYGRTLAEARARAAQAQQAGRLPSRDTVGDWLTTWIEGERGALKPQTWRKYEQVIRLHLVPHLGHLRLADLREEHLTRLYRRLARPSGSLGETMVHHVHTVLGTGLEAAVRRGAIPRNAARAVKAPRMRHRDKVILSREEAARLVELATEAPLGAAVILAVTIGARSGELRALRWRDVQLGPVPTVTVTGNLVVGYSGGAERDDPKTAAARRTVRIPEVAAAALRATPRRGILVFPSARSEGPMLASTLLRQHFRPLLAKAGLPQMPFHDLRHTAATHMLEDGVPPHVVARVLGHANVGVTLGIYAHVTGAMTDAAALAMDARYSTRGTERGTAAD